MPGRIEPAAHGMAIGARDQRLRPRLADVVEARPVLAADQQQVAKALIGVVQLITRPWADIDGLLRAQSLDELTLRLILTFFCGTGLNLTHHTFPAGDR